jgi:hypothetical protein
VERELTGATEIADPAGRLRRDAIGWSRQPLHRCDVAGLPRAYAFDYWCVATRATALTICVADVGLAGAALVSVLDLASGDIVERVYARPGRLRAAMPATPDGEFVLEARRLRLVVGARRLAAEARTITGRRIEVDLAIERAPGLETVNVLVPWDDTRFHFTSKQTALPAHGHVRIDGRDRFDAGAEAFACRDFGRGTRPAAVDWCWAFASARVGGRTLGLNLGGRWTDGTGVTENAIVIDGRVHKIADDVDFDVADRRPWCLRSRATPRVALTFTPLTRRLVRVPPLVRVHQCVGHYDGTVVDDRGETIVLDRVLGLAETVRGRW